jgi:sigma-E factor negative regulatory protein RseB
MIARFASSILTITCLIGGTVATAAGTEDARVWLERMSQALVERNYDGRFIHTSQTQSETMRIIHRYAHGQITERLVSLDGIGREYIRTNAEVTYYMPDTRSVLVESHAEKDGLLSLIPEYTPGLEAYYDISTSPANKLLERKAQLVNVQPRDEYRYGYRLWLDADTAMPLKSQLVDRQGHIVAQVAFADLVLREHIADRDLQPAVDTKGFEWIRHEIHRQALVNEVNDWRVGELPPGFKLTNSRLQSVVGSSTPVKHLVYSDGLATVSVFIDQNDTEGQAGVSLQKVGSTYAFHTDTAGYQVTAVGEVPAATVRSMVLSLTRPSGGNHESLPVHESAVIRK